MVVQHLKQIGKVKKLGKWVPRELTKNKNHCFEVTSSLILCKRRQFLGWIEMCNEKWILYDNQWWPGQWMDWEAKALLKVKLVPKKVMVTVWWSAACLIHYSFLNPGEIITSEKYAQQIDDMHQKLQLLPHRPTERVQFFSTTMLKCMSHNQCFRSSMNLTMKFCFICHIHLTSRQPTSTSSSI